MILGQKKRLSFGIGVLLIMLGIFLMYNSGFLLRSKLACNVASASHTGFVECQTSPPIYLLRAKFWSGFAVLVLGLLSLGIGTFVGRSRRTELQARITA